MFDRQELAALAQTIQIQSPRARKEQDFTLAVIFAAQVVVCAALLHFGYHLAGASGVYWAIISAILVLQPGLSQSLNASVIRIAANLIGAMIGLLVGYSLGTDGWHVVLAMVAVIFICEPLRLDFGLRTACVSAIIVMTAHGSESVLTNSVDRFIAVVVGCGLALVVQLLADRVRRRLGWHKLLAPPTSAAAALPVSPVVVNSSVAKLSATRTEE
ncbi:MAG: rane protein [Planctomycetaceae bacterium]|nr:rane protein [Planctomycetaceae bacterium]